MTLVKRNNGFLNDFPMVWDDLFGRDFFSRPMTSGTLSVPAVNVKETDDALEVEVAAPGMNKEDFHVEVNQDILTISSEKENKFEEKDENGNYTRKEFSYTTFRRSFRLPETVV
jgi:HSP20 family protein